MLVYMAASYSRRDEIAGYAEELRRLGLRVTSRWLNESQKDDKLTAKVAYRDIDDIVAADILVEFTAQDPPYRGGHIWGSGFAYGVGTAVMTIGPRENVFHYMKTIPNFESWEEGKKFLVARAKYIAGAADHKLEDPNGQGEEGTTTV